MPSEQQGGLYSSWVGLIYVFNLIVGTGALTLPAVFAHAGWLLSLILIIFLCFVSYVTVTFIIESISCANATLHLRKIEHHRIDGETDLAESSSSDEEPTEETAIVESRTTSRNFYSLIERVELIQMTTLYFNKTGRLLFFLALCVYLYGDLAIYVTAISETVCDLICHREVNSTLDFDDLCWENNEITKMTVYRISLSLFILLVGPFTYFNVQKTKYLQILTSGLRWSAFLIMIILASIHMAKHEGTTPKMFYFAGVPGLIGSSVYSFMCHHSLPGIIAPFAEKRFIIKQLALDYVLICFFYILLAMTGSFAYKELNSLYTLNFLPDSNTELNIFMQIVLYFLGAFPIFTLSMSFPIISITLQNNLKGLFFDLSSMERQNFFWRRLAFPSLAILPPVVIGFCTNNVGMLVEFTGAYAGALIQYVIPALLVWAARSSCEKDFGRSVKNKYASPFQHKIWIIFVLLWALASTIIVSIHIITKSK